MGPVSIESDMLWNLFSTISLKVSPFFVAKPFEVTITFILFLKKDSKIIKYQDEEIPDYDELLFICESSKIDESISIIQQRKENKRIKIYT